MRGSAGAGADDATRASSNLAIHQNREHTMSDPHPPPRDDEVPGSSFFDFLKVLLVIAAVGVGLAVLLLGTCFLFGR